MISSARGNTAFGSNMLCVLSSCEPGVRDPKDLREEHEGRAASHGLEELAWGGAVLYAARTSWRCEPPFDDFGPCCMPSPGRRRPKDASTVS